MSVQFVLGRPGGYAASYVDERISQLEHEDRTAPICVITPTQSTFGIEEEILQEDGLSGHLGLYVTTPQKLATEILAETYGGADEAIDIAGKSMLVRRILNDQETRLESFKDAATAAQLPFLIAEQLGRIKTMDITPEELAEYAETTGSQRFRDLSVVYTALDKQMEGLTDTERRMSAAIAQMSKARFLAETKLLVVRGFSTFTNQQIKFFEELMTVVPESIFLFPMTADTSAPDYNLYRGARMGMERLENRALQLNLTVETDQSLEEKGLVRKAPTSSAPQGKSTVRKIASPDDILFASEHVFAPGVPEHKMTCTSMTVGKASDIEQEVRAVASKIAELHLTRGIPFSRMAVVWGETSEYEPIIHRVFDEAHIPHFTGEQKSLAQSNLSEFILTAIEIATGNLNKEALLAHIATGFTRLTLMEQSVLINYAFSRITKGWQFGSKFQRNDPREFRDDFNTAEKARDKVMKPIVKYLRKPLKAEESRDEPLTGGQIFEAVENYVNAVLREDTVERMAAELGESYEQASFLEQTYKNTLSILEQAREILKDTPLTAMEARGILQSGFEAVKLSLVPAGTDEVQAGSLGRIHVPYVEDLFIVGVNDEVLPRFSSVSKDILTPSEWATMVKTIKDVEVPSSADEQKYAIIQAMRQAKRKIRWSYRTDGDNTPSVLLDYLDNIFTEPFTPEDLAPTASRLAVNAYDAAVRQVRDLADGKPFMAGKSLSPGIFNLKEFQNRTEHLEDSLTKANRAEAATISGGIGTMSATRLSSFYSCPYQHFLQHQLGLWVPRGAEINAATSGTYVHAALSALRKRANEAMAESEESSWKDLRDDLYDFAVYGALEEAAAGFGELTEDAHSRAVMEVLNEQFERLAYVLKNQFTAGRPAMVDTERQFEIPDLNVTGYIDRIDRVVRDGAIYYAIADYKSNSSQSFSLEKLLAGTDLQLLMYVLGLHTLIPEAERDRSFLASAGFLPILPDMNDKPEWWKVYRSNGFLSVPAQTALELFGVHSGKKSGALDLVQAQITGKGAYYKSDQNKLYLPRSLSDPTVPDATGTLDAMIECATDLTKNAQQRIAAGENEIKPYKPLAKSEDMPCKYCDFQSVCGFENGVGLIRPRRLVNPETNRLCRKEDLRKMLVDRYGNPLNGKEANQ